MQSQAAFMIVAPVRVGQLDDLRTLLGVMNTAPGLVDHHNDLVPLYQFSQLHMARFVILESNVGEDIREHGEEPQPWEPRLAFLGDIDGRIQPFLAELAVRADPGLRQIFTHCVGFDADSDILLDWMLQHHVKPTANYVNWLGRTVAQVHEEDALHRSLRSRLEELQGEDVVKSPGEIHEALKSHVTVEIDAGRLALTAPPKTSWRWWLADKLHMIIPPLVLLLFAPLVVVIAPFYLIRLRMLERRDPEILIRPDRETILQLASQEDQIVTNQFSAFGDVKPGLFRRYTLIFLLFALDYSSRHIYNRGYLTRVQTIHFARWVLLDNKRRLLFASNYDGSLESYMDDFINKVAWGLNLVFSNGVGYPRSRWLIKGGAEQEQKFKRYLRRHQLYTEIWYKAYPDLTAHDLARNSRIRAGFETTRFRSNDEIRAWLALI